MIKELTICFICFSVYLFSVLQLMNLTDSRLAQAGNERLELAMLSFFEQFRKIYIGDQVQKSSKVNTSLMMLLLESVHRVKLSVHSQLRAKLVGVFPSSTL